MSIARERIPSITWAYRQRGIKPDHTYQVKQGQLNVWLCANQFVSELVIGEKSTAGEITTPGAIMLTVGHAYRNTSDPQEMADDIWNCNQGDETVAQLNPSAAAAALGSIGGSSTSKAKRKASAKNGKLGGRPKKAK